MDKKVYRHLKERDILVNELARLYKSSAASKIILITGDSGSGKTYVINRMIDNLKKMLDTNIYINYGDSFVAKGLIGRVPNVDIGSITLENIIPGLSANIDLEHSDTQFRYLKRMTKKIVNKNTIFCIDNLSQAHSSIRSFFHFILDNIEDLEDQLKHKIYILITDQSAEYYIGYFINKTYSISWNHLHSYDEKDIIDYLKSKHLNLLITCEFESKIAQIKRISNGSLKLVDFLYADIQLQQVEYFEALEKVIYHRLLQLQESGSKHNITERQMEDIILSAALSLQKFSTNHISYVTSYDGNLVSDGLDMAEASSIIMQDNRCFYDFICDEVQEILHKKGLEKKKERLLFYYRYYTENEQDEYYLRAFYLCKYEGDLSSQAFALLILAYVTAKRFSDFRILECTNELIEQYANNNKKRCYHDIETLYESLLNTDHQVSPDKLYNLYKKIKDYHLELPLQGEIARACFHYYYIFSSPDNKYLKKLLQDCLQYAKNELVLSPFNNSIGLKIYDEEIVRLTIIYEIAPFILDVCNNYDEFNELYNLSKHISEKCRCRGGKGLALYIENIFNRKAFLFVNQTQCEYYYHKAEKYFMENELWEQYCITLICHAGTNIVIQEYEESIQFCNRAIKIAEEQGVEIPYLRKLYNNLYIAEFLDIEQHNKSLTKVTKQARKTIRLLNKLLIGEPSASEFVIITNICSLSLYDGDNDKYLKYKSKIEKLMHCNDISAIADNDIDDFYRYYFAWFEVYRAITCQDWSNAMKIADEIDGFVPALFKKQEIFWDRKVMALREIINSQNSVNSYDFCNNLVQTKRQEIQLANFFFRGLMLSDLQYTSY